MKQPVVDYREFRLSKIHDPRFSHLKLLLGWPVYLTGYFLTENLIPGEICTPVHMWLDDVIPFCEYFIIPYTFWYLLIVFSLVWFLLYDVDSFKRLQTYFIVTQLVALSIYVMFPTRQDLRPAWFPRDNYLTRCIGLLYSVDTNTGVCPSLHVGYSLGMLSVWLQRKGTSRWGKVFIAVAVVLICLATMFIKQHSAVDFFVALPMCALAEFVVRHKYGPYQKAEKEPRCSTGTRGNRRRKRP